MTLFKPDTRHGDFLLEAALDNISGYHGINKFGHAPDCDSGVSTDIWDGADGVTSTDIWVAPTVARVHALVSSSAEDDDAADGDGMRTVMVHGLRTWADTEETREIVSLDGATPVNTVNSYVIIYRLMGMTFGATKSNEGIIRATAATDLTITAMIHIGNGQTLMAIYGVPAESHFAIFHMHMDMIGNPTATALGSLLVETTVDQATSGNRVNREWNVLPASRYDADLVVPIVIDGPAIVKLRCVADAANVVMTGSFDGIISRTELAEHSTS